jgi:hypothetical protein
VNRESLSTLRVLTGRALQGLFEPLCGDVSISDDPPTRALLPRGETLVAAIGFRSPSLSGELVLLAPPSFVELVLPREVRERRPSARIAADWVGELANQLVGRLKNQLLGYGVDVALGTPRAVTECDIVEFETSMRTIARLSLANPEGSLLAVLFTEEHPELSLSEAMPGVAVSEGDIVLF